MPTYLLSHRHPTDYHFVRDANTAAAWTQWFEQLGGAIVDLGNPVFTREPVGECDRETMRGGYTLVEASDMTEALVFACSCPLIGDGGGIEVGELTPVPGRQHLARVF